MVATITTRGAEGIRRSHRDREEKNGLAYGFKAVTPRKGKLEDLVEVRVAFTKSGTCYAVAWIYQPPEYCPDGAGMRGSGSGSAGGYGYHKGSAAVSAALRSAGLAFNEPFGGRGWEATKEAILAAGRAMVNDAEPVYLVEVYA